MSSLNRTAKKFSEFLFGASPASQPLRSRRPLFETLEAKRLLAQTTFPGNDCAPNLDTSAIAAQSVVAGQELSFDIFTAGATIEDLDTNGDPTNDTIRIYLDPDIGTDTPEGAAITVEGVFSWTPTAAQVGTHRIVVIAVDSGTPALADAEIFTVNVTAAMPAPEVDLNGEDGSGIDFEPTFVEDGGAVLIVDTDMTVTDADDTELVSATITLTNRPDGGDESLSVDTTGTSITGSYNSTTGVIALTGTDTLANYQQVLRTLRYNNLSQAPDTTARIVEIVANDGNSSSATATATVTIQAMNDAPSVDLNGSDAGTGFAATFTEDLGPRFIVGETAFIGDVDDANLESATITITNLLDGASEVLAVDTTGTGITASYDPVTGVLSLTGSSSLTNYQEVLRDITYDNTSQNPTTTTRNIQVVVNDGTDDSTARTSTVTIVVSNDAPDLAAIADQTAVLGMDFELTVTATDPEGDTLTYQLDFDDPNASMPASATITKNNDNEAVISWTPSAGDGAGPFTFVVLVTDDGTPEMSDREEFEVAFGTAAPVIDLNGEDEAGVDFGATFTEDQPSPVAIVDADLTVSDFDSTMISSATVTITNLQNGEDESLAADVNGTAITFSYGTGTGIMFLNGVDTLANYQQVLRSVTYNNVSQDPGTDDRIITFTVNDGVNDSAVATATVTITPVNDNESLSLPAPYDNPNAPVIVNINEPISFTVTATDLDHGPSELFFFLDPESVPDGVSQPSITSPPTEVPGGVFSWTPDTVGTYVIGVFVSDDDGGPDHQEFTITVVDPAAASELNALDAAFGSLV